MRSGQSTASTSPFYQNAVDAFLIDLEAQGKRPKTIEAYRDAALQLGEYLRETAGAVPPVEAITTDQVRGFIRHLLTTKSASTANNRYRGLHRFFAWLEHNEYIDRHPMAKMEPPKIEEKVVPVLPNEALDRLLKVTAGREFTARRDRAIIAILIDTGIRLAECAGLRYDPENPQAHDVDLEYGQLRVLGKGNRERIVGLGRKTKSDLSHYLLARQRHESAYLPALWLGKRGPMTKSGIYQMVKDRGAEAGMPEIHPHQLRHTFAHQWLASGGNESDLMRLTGWRSRTMLMRYGASAGTERALEAQRRLSARDRL